MKLLKYIIILFCLNGVLVVGAQQPFTAGNIVVYRVGDGTTTLDNTAAKVYLDEYTPAGVLVQSIPMPVTGQKLTMAGSLPDAGLLNLTTNGRYLVVPGWDVDAGSNLSSVVGNNRSIAIVDCNADIGSLTVVTNNPNTSSISSATSDNGTNIWFVGNTAVEYITQGASTSTLITSLSSSSYNINISSNQLYASTNINASPMIQVGSGLPTTNVQTFTALPGFPTRTRPRQFAFADLDPNTPGVDVIYLASQNPLSPGGIQKYSLVNGSWVSNGQIGTTAESYSGLTIKISGTDVTIFATRQGANSSTVRGGELVKLTDATGYNGALTGTPTVIASVSTPDTKAFRGVALVPQPVPFTPGNIVVYRVGDGSKTLDITASKVYLDEYTPSGTLVQSILMPVSGQRLTMAGSLPDAGFLNLSTDGKYLVVPGWDVNLGTSLSSAFGNNRSIGLINFNAAIQSITTVTNNPNNSSITSATSDNGSNLWFNGNSAVEYITAGTSTSTLLTNIATSFNIHIADNQLYVSTNGNTNPLVQVGAGLPTAGGQTLTILPGFPTRTRPRQFAFADLEPSIPGADVVYLASQNPLSPGGIQKYSLVGGAWVFNGQVGTTSEGYSGLTIRVSAGIVTIFATRRGSNSSSVSGGELVSFTDNSGYNGTLIATPVTIASVSVTDTKAFRGVARVPVGCATVNSLSVPDISSTQANIIWNAPNGGNGNYEFGVTTSATPPASGTATTNTSASVTGLTNATTYYAHVRSSCSASGKSEWSTVMFTTGCKAPASPLVTIDISNSGTFTAKWNKVFGAASYEYFISTSATAPSSGYATTDTSLSVSNLNSITQYYIHVRSNCGSGTYSPWTTKAFTTGCFMPSPKVTVLTKAAGVKWNKIANAVKYEYALTYTSGKPLGGNYATDTIYSINKIDDGTAYYFHVRAICGTGAVSEWATIAFNTIGLEVYPNPVKDVLNIQLNGINNSSAEIMIGDAMGRIISRLRLNNSTATVNTRSWAPGIYLVRYDDGKNKYSVRIVKQ